MAISMYLKIEGVPGECSIEDYKEQIQLESFAHSVSQQASVTTAVNGAVSGQAMHSDFNVVKMLDKSSPVLSQKCSVGEIIPSVTLTLVRAAGTDKTVPYMIYTMTNVIVSNISVAGSKSSDWTTESVSFNYEKINWEYTQQKRKDGSGGGKTTGSWNAKTGKTK
jgi:type VI secretion system secreted protein Hcp